MCLKFGLACTWMCQVQSFAVNVQVCKGKRRTEKVYRGRG